MLERFAIVVLGVVALVLPVVMMAVPGAVVAASLLLTMVLKVTSFGSVLERPATVVEQTAVFQIVMVLVVRDLLTREDSGVLLESFKNEIVEITVPCREILLEMLNSICLNAGFLFSKESVWKMSGPNDASFGVSKQPLYLHTLSNCEGVSTDADVIKKRPKKQVIPRMLVCSSLIEMMKRAIEHVEEQKAYGTFMTRSKDGAIFIKERLYLLECKLNLAFLSTTHPLVPPLHHGVQTLKLW